MHKRYLLFIAIIFTQFSCMNNSFKKITIEAEVGNQINLTKKIQKSISKLGKKGGRLILPNGTYEVNGFLIGNEEIEYERFEIVGRNTKLILRDQANKSILDIRNVKNLILEGITIMGNKENQKPKKISGIKVSNCDEVSISNCSVLNCVQSGLIVHNAQNVLISGGQYSNNGINSKKIFSDGIALSDVMTGTIENTTCNNNNSGKTMDGDGIQLGSSEESYEKKFTEKNNTIRILNNSCSGNGRRGLKVQRSNVVVSNNKFYNNKSKQIAIVQYFGLNNIVVVENELSNVDSECMQLLVIHSGKDHISTHKDIRIEKNKFKGKIVNEGILIDDTKNLIFENNNVEITSQKKTSPALQITKRCEDINVILNEEIELKDSGKKSKIIKKKL